MRSFSSSVITPSNCQQQSPQAWQSQFCITGSSRNGNGIDAYTYQPVIEVPGNARAPWSRQGLAARSSPETDTNILAIDGGKIQGTDTAGIRDIAADFSTRILSPRPTIDDFTGSAYKVS